MANYSSVAKSARQNIKRNERNNAYRTQVKTATKKTLAAIASSEKDQAPSVLKQAVKTISKVASKGVIHKRSAARKISQLAKRTHKVASTG